MRIITVLMTNMSNYVRDPKEITRLSSAAIRCEADLTAVPEDIMPLALKIEGQLFSVLSEEERASLLDMLVRVRDQAGDFDAESLAD